MKKLNLKQRLYFGIAFIAVALALHFIQLDHPLFPFLQGAFTGAGIVLLLGTIQLNKEKKSDENS